MAGKAGGLSQLEMLAAIIVIPGEGNEDTPVSISSKWTSENSKWTCDIMRTCQPKRRSDENT